MISRLFNSGMPQKSLPINNLRIQKLKAIAEERDDYGDILDLTFDEHDNVLLFNKSLPIEEGIDKVVSFMANLSDRPRAEVFFRSQENNLNNFLKTMSKINFLKNRKLQAFLGHGNDASALLMDNQVVLKISSSAEHTKYPKDTKLQAKVYDAKSTGSNHCAAQEWGTPDVTDEEYDSFLDAAKKAGFKFNFDMGKHQVGKFYEKNTPCIKALDPGCMYK